MRTTLFCSVPDVADAGPDAVLDDALDRATVDGVAIAAYYHAARDLHPHARGRRVCYLPPGLWIARDAALWADCPVQPPRAGDDATEAAATALVAAAAQRGATVDGWCVFLHTDRGPTDGDAGVPVNAFGDPAYELLCPANPAARQYAVTLARSVVRSGLRTVLAESLHHHGLEHGLHHERYLLEPGSVARFLLGLCLCAHCRAGAAAEGIDGDRLAEDIRALLEGVLASGEPADGDVASAAGAAALLDGRVGALLRARTAAVTTLIAEVANACTIEGGELVVLDSSGAAKGYADGRPTGGPAVDEGWRFGLDVAAIAAHCTVEAIAYARDPARVELDLAAYRDALGAADLGAIIRPFGPDGDEVRAKVACARAAGLQRLDFYHYGLMPLPVLDRIAAALA